ncbi:MAG TPA: alpha/beta hydrolase, partial [Gammaproteobacteria bacterium]|nr:alpha/beta hydrolase [Gammaproteobacteria bacterium]
MKIPVILLSLACCCSAASARADISSGYVSGADAVRIHVLQAGPADSPHSILFLPGHMIGASIWTQQLNDFAAQGYRVVALDARSQGESGQAKDNAPQDRARDIQAVVTGLKLTHLTLVGWSQGVQDVAAYVGQTGTGALERIVLVDSSVSRGPDAVKETPGFLRA